MSVPQFNYEQEYCTHPLIYCSRKAYHCRSHISGNLTLPATHDDDDDDDDIDDDDDNDDDDNNNNNNNNNNSAILAYVLIGSITFLQHIITNIHRMAILFSCLSLLITELQNCLKERLKFNEELFISYPHSSLRYVHSFIQFITFLLLVNKLTAFYSRWHQFRT